MILWYFGARTGSKQKCGKSDKMQSDKTSYIAYLSCGAMTNYSTIHISNVKQFVSTLHDKIAPHDAMWCKLLGLAILLHMTNFALQIMSVASVTNIIQIHLWHDGDDTVIRSLVDDNTYLKIWLNWIVHQGNMSLPGMSTPPALPPP